MASLRAMAGVILSELLLGLPTAMVADAQPGTAAVQYANLYADCYGVPRELVHAVIEVESGWQPAAVSPKGAAGIMQLMPATAVAFGVRSRFMVDQNIRAGVAYLARLMARFGGDLRLVAAAYFAGEQRVAAHGLALDSREVHGYVRKVAAIYRRERIEAASQRNRQKEGFQDASFLLVRLTLAVLRRPCTVFGLTARYQSANRRAHALGRTGDGGPGRAEVRHCDQNA